MGEKGIGVTELPAASTRTVERALGLLAEVCAADGITLTALARRTGLPPSTALRLLRTLERSGFASRAASGRFRPGPRMLLLGAQALGRQTLVRLAQPALERIVAVTGETAYLVTRGPEETAVYLAMVEGTHPVRHTSWVGRAIQLADIPVARALRGDVPATGYIGGKDRLEPDVTAIAAPIRWAGGVAGALNLLGPTYRIDAAALRRFGAVVAAEADDVGRRLGADAGPAVLSGGAAE